MLHALPRMLGTFVAFTCVALTNSSCRQRAAVAAPPPLVSTRTLRPSLAPDQANTANWQNAWTNIVNDVRQTFTPSLPKLAAVEVQLILANPGPPDDRLTLELLDSGEHAIGIVSKTVSTADCEHVLFVFPSGGADVAPGQLYTLRLSGGLTFGWKYVVNGYQYGSASFNGRPLLDGARSSFLFQTFGTK